MKLKELIVPKEDVVYPDSAKTHIFKTHFELPFTYEDNSGKVLQGSLILSFLGNNKYDMKLIPDLPDCLKACICNSFFGQYNRIYNEVLFPPK